MKLISIGGVWKSFVKFNQVKSEFFLCESRKTSSIIFDKLLQRINPATISVSKL